MNFGKRKHFGKIGEDHARALLKNRGYKILTRNYKTKLGEIDIIALDGDTLVFVEVKTRFSKSYGKPEEAVGKKKLERIGKVGEIFLRSNPQFPRKLRIDVVAVTVLKEGVLTSKIIKVI